MSVGFEETITTVDGRPGVSSVCGFCENLVSTADRSCDAFDKIPDTIWLGENDHREPVPGDGGIRFESVLEE